MEIEKRFGVVLVTVIEPLLKLESVKCVLSHGGTYFSSGFRCDGRYQNKILKMKDEKACLVCKIYQCTN